MRPVEPAGSCGTTTLDFARDTAALAGLAALETVADFAVFLIEGKYQSYQLKSRSRGVLSMAWRTNVVEERLS